MRLPLIVRGLVGLVMVSAIASCDADQPAAQEQTTVPSTTTATTTPATVADTVPAWYIDPASVSSTDDVGYESLGALEVGEVRPVNIWAWCDFAIEVDGEWYQSDLPITMQGSNGYTVSDFPPGWDVAIFNEAPSDGPNWVILNAVVERLDASTLEARNLDDDTVIDQFELDTTPAEQRMC